nr:AAA family ATPase [uncultured Bacteroides sp.]
MMQNNLFLNRLYILTDESKIAYDETFHKGVNIIRGDNSSGKSTITHFIFYVLGGAFNDFVPEACKCSMVQAEIEMNGAIFTIKRYLNKDNEDKISTQSPMFFYWGSMNESFNPPADKNWQKFGYKTTAERKSFSNVLFDNIGLPIVKGDSNITFHQILRLLYIDQESPTSSLFYYEHFDSQLTRETVADLLLGIYNEELYECKKRLTDAKKEYENIKNEIKAVKSFFPDPLTTSPSHIEVIIENREKEISDIQDQIIAIRKLKQKENDKNKAKFSFQELNEKTIQQRKIVITLENKINYLENENQDSLFFIETLNNKIKALKNSIETRDFLGSLPLEYCPECLTKIASHHNMSKCKLCKEDVDKSFGVVQARRMEQEIGFQINESLKILETNKNNLLILKAKYQAEFFNLQLLQNQVDRALMDVKSSNEEVIDQLNVNKGFIEGEILQFKSLLENAKIYEALLEKEASLKKEITYLSSFIFKTEKSQAELKNSINDKIKEEGTYLLNNDLDRQDEFKNANDFFIDFSNNIAFLSNKYSKYSASSNFYLKVSARFAIFLASLSIPLMRFPRYIFADNMEDKGIEPERAQNLQKILIERVNRCNSNNFQMIYTTSYITKELNESKYVVGEYYTKTNPSLKNIPKY